MAIWDLKKRKKFEPTSTAVPAASAASICLEEVMPALPSGVGQSLGSMIRTGLTSHHIGWVFTLLLSTTCSRHWDESPRETLLRSEKL